MNPSTPLRSIYFKAFGHEKDPVSNFVDIAVTDNTVASEIKVQFDKNKTNKLKSLSLIACYSYASYTNLQDLCNTQTMVQITDAEGTCFSKINLQYETSKVD